MHVWARQELRETDRIRRHLADSTNLGVITYTYMHACTWDTIQ